MPKRKQINNVIAFEEWSFDIVINTKKETLIVNRCWNCSKEKGT
jgi:hypothetical protein